MKKIAFVYCLLAIFLFACSKEEEQLQTFKLDANAMKYIQLKPWGYFIYKDSASGQLDSVIATGTVLSVQKFDYEDSYTKQVITAWREKFYLTLTSKTNGAENLWLTGHAYAHQDPLTLAQNDISFVYPSPTTTIGIDGTTYSDVIVTSNKSGFTFYWAPNVGIIKAIRPDPVSKDAPPHTFTLLRHN